MAVYSPIMDGYSDQRHCADLVRRHDRDRWLTAALAPAADRPRLLALYALNVELSRIGETVNEPLAGRIRLQWWREALESAAGGPPGDHPVLREIAPELAAGRIAEAPLGAYLDALEADLEGLRPSDLAAFEDRARASGGGLTALAARLIGTGEADGLAAAEEVGTAHGMIARLLNAPWWASRGRDTLPGEGTEAASAIAARAGQLLAEARARRHRVSRAVVPALLIGPMTEVRIRRLARCGFDPASPRAEPLPHARPLAVLKGALTGRY